MRVAFYAPLKAPTHPVPSGDRMMARLLMAALREAGCTVDLASTLRSHDGSGDPRRQQRLAAIGARMARRQLDRVARGAARPDLWFTYHLYHRAPDWIGPPVARALGIPYVVAEASVAAKQAGGPWDHAHEAVLDALGQAALVLTLNPADAEGVARVVPAARLASLPAFVDTGPFTRASENRPAARRQAAVRYDLDPAQPWLVAVGMMRSRAKLLSYAVLGEALATLRDRPWQLLAVGDGPARAEVRQALAPLGDRVRFAGLVTAGDLPELLTAGDVMVWPAIDEAYGMALLEAQAAGLPVVAGRSDGVAAIVADGVGGRLATPGDSDAFARALAPLLDDPALRRRMGDAARRSTEAHDLRSASRRLKSLLEGLLHG